MGSSLSPKTGKTPLWWKIGIVVIFAVALLVAATACGEGTPRPRMSGDTSAGPIVPRSAPQPSVDTTYQEPEFGTLVLDSVTASAARRGVRAAPAPGAIRGVDTTVSARGDSIATPWVTSTRLGQPDTFYRVASGGETPSTPKHTMRLGAYNCPDGIPPNPYNACAWGVRPYSVVDVIAANRAAGTRVMLLLNGGNHARYRVREDDERWRQRGYNQRFSMRVWKDSLARYDTPAIRQAIANGVADGTIIGHAVMDEPGNVSTATGNYWAYPGFMTRETVNELCRESKRLFPTMPVGPVQDPRHFTAGQYTTDCDFTHAQYRLTKDRDLDSYIVAVKQALPAHMGIIWSINTVHGGEPSTTCPKFGDDPSGKLCPVTPTQLKNWALRFARDPRACGMVNTWRWEPGLTDKADYRAAAREVVAAMATMPATPCTARPE